MPASSRRQFLHQTSLAAAALCAPLSKVLAAARSSPESQIRNMDLIDAASVRKLASQIGGHVIAPGMPDYDASRLVFNRAFDRRPALIVRCAGLADVTRALGFAQSRNLPLAIRGGGHSRLGYGTCDGGAVIDLSAMKQIEVDAEKKV